MTLFGHIKQKGCCDYMKAVRHFIRLSKNPFSESRKPVARTVEKSTCMKIVLDIQEVPETSGIYLENYPMYVLAKSCVSP